MMKHFTATVYIVAIVDGEPKLLLHKHKKLGLWLAMGGHIEADENMVDAALREGREESGLTDLTLIGGKKDLMKTAVIEEIPAPYAVLEELIPAHGDQPEHIHIDCIYFAATRHPEEVDIHGGEAYGWFTSAELDDERFAPEVKEIGNAAMHTLRA